MARGKGSSVLLRPARHDDAPALAEVEVEAWKTAYAGLLPDSLLARLDRSAAVQRWRGRLPPPAGELCRVAADTRAPAVIVGWVAACRDRSGSVAGEVRSLYLRSDRRGEGVGALLLKSAEEWLSAEGYHTARLWVLAGNARARSFYRRNGWCEDGAERIEVRDGVELREVRLRRQLA